MMAGSGERLFSAKGAGWPLSLLVVGVLTLLLGVVQWMELLLAQVSGETFCSLNETFDCASVWAHPMAKAIQRVTYVPVAGWGIVWALGASVTAVWILRCRLEGRTSDLPSMVARVFGAAGIGTALALFALSVSMGTYCLTCLATYALALVYGGLAFNQPTERPLGAQKGTAPVLWSGALVVIGYLLVLYPGTRTPVDPAKEALAQAAAAAKKAGAATNVAKTRTDPVAKTDPKAPSTALGRFLAELNPAAKQAVSKAFDEMKASPTPSTSQFTIRKLHHGPADAKVKMIDFSDILCGHCAQLAAATDELRRMSTEEAFSQESRWFPLDAECNNKLDPKMTDGSGVRCAGARAMICLEDNPAYDKARRALFEAQEGLKTAEQVIKIAGDSAAISQADLQACMTSPKTDAELRQDIEYAWSYRLEGTPLVLINGRKSAPIGPFLYAIILAQGDLSHSGWTWLSPGH